MRVSVEPIALRDSGFQWSAKVEYGPGFVNTFVAHGSDPLAAALKLARYVAEELVEVREKASRL